MMQNNSEWGMSNRGPVESFARHSSGFHYSITSLYCDNLSLFWKS